MLEVLACMDLSRRNVTRSESGSPAHVSFRDIVRNKGLLKRIPYYLNCRLICTSLKIYILFCKMNVYNLLFTWLLPYLIMVINFLFWQEHSYLRNFQNLILKYTPRQHSYTPLVYKARNLIAALDYNSNCERFKKKRWLLEVIWFSMLKLFNLKLIQRAKNKINPKSKN